VQGMVSFRGRARVVQPRKLWRTLTAVVILLVAGLFSVFSIIYVSVAGERLTDIKDTLVL